jgi:TetR/AcrR family transcriptional repressor of nem operon
MTDSIPERGKRQRLIASARELVHRQGVERPTLAQIAEAADIPPGNVYYYFKTKDQLIEGVIESREEGVRERLGSLSRRRSPAARLKALARNWLEVKDLVAAEGCPLGTLAVELNNHGNGLDGQAARLFSALIDWSEHQFREMGCIRDPEIRASQVQRLERWIDSLA